MGKRIVRGRTLAMGALLATSLALAQESGKAPPPPLPPPVAAPANEVPAITNQQLARAITRLALLDLRAREEPSPEDYEIACHLLGYAESLTPDDAELVRRRVEAAANWGDADTIFACTRRVVQLDPKDTVAQLRYIAAAIGKQSDQTGEGRLKTLESYSGNTKLDESVRSRLALDAAMLARDMGDDAKFASMLKQSTTLDGTNKEAALLALNYYEQRVGDAEGRLELLSNLLYADPLDPNTHLRISRELASAGAFTSSRRFFRIVQAIRTQARTQQTLDMEAQRLNMDACVDGPQGVHRYLLDQLVLLRKDRVREIEDRKQQNLPINDVPPPEEVRLPISFEPIRMVTALMSGDEADARSSVVDMGKSQALNAEILNDPLRRPQGSSDDEARDRIGSELLAVQLWRAVTGLDNQTLIDAMPDTLRMTAEDDPLRSVIESMAAARQGDVPRAEQLLQDAEDNEWTSLARATAADVEGKREDAAAAYIDAFRQAPMGVLGLFARWRWEQLSGGPTPEFVRVRDAREKFAGTIPLWVDQMARDPHAFQTLSVSVKQPEKNSLDPAVLEVSIRNNGRRPLGFGASRTINSRLEFAPHASFAGRSVLSVLRPEVLDVERRLRLLPREEVRVRVTPEVGAMGWVCETLSAVPGTLSWRVIQGFQISEGGAHRAGPGCLETGAEPVSRPPLPESRVVPAELATRLLGAGEQDMPKLLIAARSQLVGLSAQQDTRDKREAIASALAKVYPTLSPRVRMLMLTALPPMGELPELEVLDAEIAKEVDPAVLPLAIISRPRNGESPLFAAARASGDATLMRLADLQAARLVGDAPTYSRAGTGLVAKLVDVLNNNVQPANSAPPQIFTPPPAPPSSPAPGKK